MAYVRNCCENYWYKQSAGAALQAEWIGHYWYHFFFLLFSSASLYSSPRRRCYGFMLICKYSSRKYAWPLINTSGHFSALMSGGTTKVVAFSGNSKHFLFFQIKPHYFHLKSYFFCKLKPRAKYQNPRTTPSQKFQKDKTNVQDRNPNSIFLKINH